MAYFFKYLKADSYACFQDQTFPQTLPKLFPANASPSPPSSNQYIMAIIYEPYKYMSPYRAALSSGTHWLCYLNAPPWSLPKHNSMAIHQETRIYPAHPRAAYICQSLQCLVVSKVTDEGQPWIALLSTSTCGPH